MRRHKQTQSAAAQRRSRESSFDYDWQPPAVDAYLRNDDEWELLDRIHRGEVIRAERL